MATALSARMRSLLLLLVMASVSRAQLTPVPQLEDAAKPDPPPKVPQLDDAETPPRPPKVVLEAPEWEDLPQLAPAPLYRLPPPRLEKRRMWGLFTAGASMAGLFWMVSGAVGAQAGSPELLIPIAGPFIEMSRFSAGDGWIVNIPLAMTGFIEASGVVMMIVGVAVKHDVELPGGLKVSAIAGDGGGRLALTGRF